MLFCKTDFNIIKLIIGRYKFLDPNSETRTHTMLRECGVWPNGATQYVEKQIFKLVHAGIYVAIKTRVFTN